MTTSKTPMTFTVTGTGQFPTDMLRYDQCWPATSEDAVLMCPHRPSPTVARSVRLRTHGSVTAARWASFGWTAA